MDDKSSNLIVMAVVIIVLMFAFSGAFGVFGYGNMMYNFGSMMFFNLIISTLVIIALVLLIIWIVNQIHSGGRK